MIASVRWFVLTATLLHVKNAGNARKRFVLLSHVFYSDVRNKGALSVVFNRNIGALSLVFENSPYFR